MIHIERITSGVEKEIDRLADGPTLIDLEKFENVLLLQYVATQQAVHVQTRSLKNSGKIASSTGQNSWEGIISYGGPAPGSIHNPVDYAEFERERDGNHDFLAPTKGLEAYYVQAMNEFLGG
jgi:hypothetical protein